MGLDELHLRVLSQSSDDEKERNNARTGQLERPKLPTAHTTAQSSSCSEGAATGSSSYVHNYWHIRAVLRVGTVAPSVQRRSSRSPCHARLN